METSENFMNSSTSKLLREPTFVNSRTPSNPIMRNHTVNQFGNALSRLTQNLDVKKIPLSKEENEFLKEAPSHNQNSSITNIEKDSEKEMLSVLSTEAMESICRMILEDQMRALQNTEHENTQTFAMEELELVYPNVGSENNNTQFGENESSILKTEVNDVDGNREHIITGIIDGIVYNHERGDVSPYKHGEIATESDKNNMLEGDIATDVDENYLPEDNSKPLTDAIHPPALRKISNDKATNVKESQEVFNDLRRNTCANAAIGTKSVGTVLGDEASDDPTSLDVVFTVAYMFGRVLVDIVTHILGHD